MHDSQAVNKDLLLVGGGHAHVIALRMLVMHPVAGLRMTLISPDTHTPYSGMLPGLIAGHYSFEQSHIDLERLCQWAGVRFVRAQVNAIDTDERSVSLVGRPPVNYDLLSIDIGSQPELDSVPGAREWSVPVKPVSSFWQRWQQLIAQAETSPGSGTRRIVVVGGGAGSVELILAMAQRLPTDATSLTLVCGAQSILDTYNARARRAVTAELAAQGVTLLTGARVESVSTNSLTLTDGSNQSFDTLFWCTGAAPAPWLAGCGLETDDAGFLLTRDTLQLLAHDDVFAVGDTASQQQHPRPKAGVYAVRQGPVLADNLRNALRGQALHHHVPQQRFLSLLSLGKKRATADRGIFNVTGDWVWRWKDRIDRQFMLRFQDLPKRMFGSPRSDTNTGDSITEQMPCGGCGAKVGASSLGAVLGKLASRFPATAASGLQARDSVLIPDSASYSLVQSIDVLRQLVSDHWLMGRIAANHALSDLYACGARPVSALATVTLPFSSPTIQERDLEQLLAGALHEFDAVACPLQGGHSLQGAELNIGFVVNGAPMCADRGYLSKQGLRDGDVLVLTKPLGTGVLFAAHMQHEVDGRYVHSAIDNMLQSNQRAAALAVEFNASACTDVTGFGLLGHLLEMLPEELGAHLELSRIPVLGGVEQCLALGVRSTMHDANATALAALGAKIRTTGPDAIVDLLVDPQTSGGLLIGVAADDAAKLLQALQNAGYANSAVIGQVEIAPTSG